MKKLFPFYIVAFLLTFASCANDDDNFQNQPIVNEGEVSFDGIRIPLTYADLYFIENFNNGDELWGLILSENFIRPGQTQTDAYLYMEFVRPAGGALYADYFIGNPVRPVLFAAYFEDVLLQNGEITDFSFTVSDDSVVDGSLRLRLLNREVNDVDVRLETFDGFFLDAYFRGLLRF